MPLVVLCGFPCSGKSRRAREAADGLRAAGLRVELVRDEDCDSAESAQLAEAEQEKRARAALKAACVRALRPDTTVILDAPNYIKGFRYELYCASKAAGTPQVTLYTIIHQDEAKKRNLASPSPRTEEHFNSLITRFEEPNERSRWDRPLLIVGAEEELPLEALLAAVRGAAPPPNTATQNAPLAPTNWLHEADIATAAELQHMLAEPGAVPTRLQRLRRQFLVYARAHHSTVAPSALPALFRHYIDTALQR